eukprot:4259743-Prymnesium_polylepis.1
MGGSDLMRVEAPPSELSRERPPPSELSRERPQGMPQSSGERRDRQRRPWSEETYQCTRVTTRNNHYCSDMGHGTR